jgi:hypothetical protein
MILESNQETQGRSEGLPSAAFGPGRPLSSKLYALSPKEKKKNAVSLLSHAL